MEAMEDRMESLTQKRSQVQVLFRPLEEPLYMGVFSYLGLQMGGVSFCFAL